MFPKYKAGPINGDRVNESELGQAKTKVDISALLGGNVYSLLRDRSQRSQSRFSKERSAHQAFAERQQHLAELAQDIPREVLQNLPSPEALARQAELAAAKTRAALAPPPK